MSRKQKSGLVVLLLYSFLYMGCGGKGNEVKSKTDQSVSDTISVHNFATLELFLFTDSGKTQIVNFWAMWCTPCVKELPIIEDYAKKHPDTDVLLISLDFPKDIETKLKPFLKNKNITSKVILLDDSDANSWIDKINPDWSGAIPFTIIFNNEKRSYHERVFENLEDLENEIKKTINN